jgi:GDP-mannose 6-dehydrogenase
LGITIACTHANEGHVVIGVDVDANRILSLAQGHVPFHEPQLNDSFAKACQSGRLTLTSDDRFTVDKVDIIMVCVGTPSAQDGALDLGAVIAATDAIARALLKLPPRRLTLVYRSTLLPGTTRSVIWPYLLEALGRVRAELIELVYAPEFLREGHAVADCANPRKIVFGTADGTPSTRLRQLLGQHRPAFNVSFEAAELTKLIDNSWHATKVAFANETSRIANHIGLASAVMHDMFLADAELNLSATYTMPGGPFGGSCLPKDVRALANYAAASELETPIISSLLSSNAAHKQHLAQSIASRVQPGGSILMSDLAFKSNTDDQRDSPYIELTQNLLDRGFEVSLLSHTSLFPDRTVSTEIANAVPWDMIVITNADPLDLDLTTAPIFRVNSHG